MNTRISYLYRDADNYKVQNSVVICGDMTEEQQKKIIDCLDASEYFVPSQVGMPEKKFGCDTEADHAWFEWQGVEETEQEPTLDITAEELVKKFENFLKRGYMESGVEVGGKKAYCVTIQETLSRTVVVWAKDRLDAEERAYDLCNAGTINLGDKDFADRLCTCDGAATPGDTQQFQEYGLSNWWERSVQ